MTSERDLAEKLIAADWFGEAALADGGPVDLPAKYRVLRCLGRGGAGTVYLARDESLDRSVALKLLHDHRPAVLERFRREARLLARLENPAIVKVYEMAVEGGQPYIAMQYVAGGNLGDARLEPRELARVLCEVANALAHAHDHGIVHRDIKPANILLDEHRRALLTDFGIARDLFQAGSSVTLSQPGDLIGTPSAMSPEQARGDLHAVDARSDVYALGATLYYLLSGRWPFVGQHVVEVLHAVLHEEPPFVRSLRADAPRALEAIAFRCLRKDRSERYQSMRELALELDRFAHQQAVQSESQAWFAKLVRKIANRPEPPPRTTADGEPHDHVAIEAAREISAWDADLYRLSRGIHRSFPRLHALEAKLAQVLCERPDVAWARYYRAAVLKRLGRLDEALDEMERAIDRAARLPGACFELGRLYLAIHLRAQGEARKHLNHVGVAHHLEQAKGRLAQAALAFEEARRLDPSLPTWQLAYVDAVRALARQDFGESVAQCDRVLAEEPDAEEVWKLRGDALRLAGLDPCESYDRAIAIRRSYFEACLAKAEALLASGTFAAARQSIDQALAIHPDCVDALVLAARTDLIETGRSSAGDDRALARALELVERAIALERRHYQAHLTRAEILIARATRLERGEDLAEALATLERSRELEGCQNRVQFTIARTLLERARMAARHGMDPRADLDRVLSYACDQGASVPGDRHWERLRDDVRRERAALD